jgi:group I intron endonuclease
MFIYLLQSPISDKVYIGQTWNLKDRYKSHRFDSLNRTKTHKDKWYKKYTNLGWEPQMSTLCECEESEVDKMERFYISFFKQMGFKLTNAEDGGNLNKHHSNETKLKISKSKMGCKSWNKGLNLSPEHASKTRIANQTKESICNHVRQDYLLNFKHGIINTLSNKYDLNRHTIAKIIGSTPNK